jgi:hypothetical protein
MELLHLIHHGGIAVRLVVSVCALVLIYVLLKMAEYAIIPE